MIDFAREMEIKWGVPFGKFHPRLTVLSYYKREGLPSIGRLIEMLRGKK